VSDQQSPFLLHSENTCIAWKKCVSKFWPEQQLALFIRFIYLEEHPDCGSRTASPLPKPLPGSVEPPSRAPGPHRHLAAGGCTASWRSSRRPPPRGRPRRQKALQIQSWKQMPSEPSSSFPSPYPGGTSSAAPAITEFLEGVNLMMMIYQVLPRKFQCYGGD
jgi:hypothetical protein